MRPNYSPGIIPCNPNAPAQHQAQAPSGYSSRQTCCIAPLKVKSFQCFHRSQADSIDNTAKIILQETITSSNFIYRKRVDELRNYLFRILTNRIKLQNVPDLLLLLLPSLLSQTSWGRLDMKPFHEDFPGGHPS